MNELFPDFSENEIAFNKTKGFWRALVADEVSHIGTDGEWSPWTHEDEWCTDPDLLDGAIVFSIYSKIQNKGLRVQQSCLKVSSSKAPYLDAHTDIFGEGILESPIPNVCISAIPTLDNQPIIRKIIRHWLRKDTRE